jgi:hypothetical protein
MKTLILSLAITLMAFTNPPKNVYICTGRYAKVYHTNRYCRGLKNCKGEIVKVSLSDAIKKYGRRECKECDK